MTALQDLDAVGTVHSPVPLRVLTWEDSSEREAGRDQQHFLAVTPHQFKITEHAVFTYSFNS